MINWIPVKIQCAGPLNTPRKFPKLFKPTNAGKGAWKIDIFTFRSCYQIYSLGWIRLLDQMKTWGIREAMEAIAFE